MPKWILVAFPWACSSESIALFLKVFFAGWRVVLQFTYTTLSSPYNTYTTFVTFCQLKILFVLFMLFCLVLFFFLPFFFHSQGTHLESQEVSEVTKKRERQRLILCLKSAAVSLVTLSRSKSLSSIQST